MSAPNLAEILRLPGKLSHSPTDLTTAYPHGGTALGTCGRVALRPISTPFVVTGWEFGGAAVDVVQGGPGWTLDATLREWDPDALGILFPCYATGAQGGATLQLRAQTAASRAGIVVGASFSRVVVFTPDGTDDLPLILIRRAVPAIVETAEMALRGNTDAGIAVRWYATPDSSARIADVGRRRELTL